MTMPCLRFLNIRVGMAGAAMVTLVAAGYSTASTAAAFMPALAGAPSHVEPPRIVHAWRQGTLVRKPGGIVPTAAAAASNEDHAELLFKIGLLEGHLMVGRELIEAGQPRLALPHFGHPVRELYDDIADELKRRGVTPFDGELIALEALVTGKPRDPATMAKYNQVVSIIAAVRATVPSGLLDNERFVLGVLTEIATISAEDYSESIEGGRIEKPVEYHDSRGYLAYASKELSRLEARPASRGSSRLAVARAKLGEMQAITGSLLPPDRPVKSVAAYKAIVGQFKQAAAAGA